MITVGWNVHYACGAIAVQHSYGRNLRMVQSLFVCSINTLHLYTMVIKHVKKI